jgi:hypothetical protein
LVNIRLGDRIEDWGVEPFVGGRHSVEGLLVQGESLRNVPGNLLHPALAFDARLIVVDARGGMSTRFGYGASAVNMLRIREADRLPDFAANVRVEVLAKCSISVRSGVPADLPLGNVCYLVDTPGAYSKALSVMMADVLGIHGFQCYHSTETTAEIFKARLRFFVEATEGVLVVFFGGDGSEVGGRMQLNFADRGVDNEELGKFLGSLEKRERSKLVFLSDCGHRGGAFSLIPGERPRGALGLSSCGNSTPGLFTFCLCKHIAQSPAVTPADLLSGIERMLADQGEKGATVGLEMTSWYLFERPLLVEAYNPSDDERARSSS